MASLSKLFGQQGANNDLANLLDPANGVRNEILRLPHEEMSHIETAAFSPDGRLALTGSDDNTARLWDVATGEPLRIILGH